jgi:hypothetical protein
MKRKYQWFTLLASAASVAALVGCAELNSNTTGQITHESFGQTKEGVAVELFTLKNSRCAIA